MLSFHSVLLFSFPFYKCSIQFVLSYRRFQISSPWLFIDMCFYTVVSAVMIKRRQCQKNYKWQNFQNKRNGNLVYQSCVWATCKHTDVKKKMFCYPDVNSEITLNIGMFCLYCANQPSVSEYMPVHTVSTKQMNNLTAPYIFHPDVLPSCSQSISPVLTVGTWYKLQITIITFGAFPQKTPDVLTF